MKSLIFDKISFEQGKRHFRTPPRPSTRHLEKNPLSTTVFKGLDFIQCFNLRKLIFGANTFRCLFRFTKCLLSVGSRVHTTTFFSPSQTSSYLKYKTFVKMQCWNYESFRKQCYSPEIARNTLQMSESPFSTGLRSLRCSKMKLQNIKVYIFYFRNFVFFYFRENEKSRVPFSKQSAGKSSILRESSILSKFHF